MLVLVVLAVLVLSVPVCLLAAKRLPAEPADVAGPEGNQGLAQPRGPHPA